jgi:hypothetical protein
VKLAIPEKTPSRNFISNLLEGVCSMNPWTQKCRKIFILVALFATVVLAGPAVVSAQTAGYDLFQTSSGASVDLSSLGLGVVPLVGVPIQTSTGNTDTIMHRTQDVPPGGGTVALNVYALFMKSASSVTYSGRPADVYVTINNTGGAVSTSVLPQPDSLAASSGSMTVRSDGTFDSSVTINADIIIVPAGGSPSGTSLAHSAAPAISISTTNSTWSSTAPAGYPSAASLPSGGIYPRPVHNASHPVAPASCGPATRSATQPGGAARPGAPTGNALQKACITAN